jgi:hypothetical protein
MRRILLANENLIKKKSISLSLLRKEAYSSIVAWMSLGPASNRFLAGK